MDQRILEVLGKAKKVGYREEPVKVSFGVIESLVLGTLTSTEESEAHTYAQMQGRAIPFFFAFKRKVLSFSIKDINGVRLDEVSFVTTDERDDEGNFMRIPVHKAVMDTVETWPSVFVDFVYLKYMDVRKKVESSLKRGLTTDDLQKYNLEKAEEMAGLDMEKVSEAVRMAAEETVSEAPEVPVGESPVPEMKVPLEREMPSPGGGLETPASRPQRPAPPPEVRPLQQPVQEEPSREGIPHEEPSAQKEPLVRDDGRSPALTASYKEGVEPPPNSRIVSRAPTGNARR